MQEDSEPIEITATIDEQGRLVLDRPLPITGPRRVRVQLIAAPDETGDLDDQLESSFTLADGQPWPGGTLAGD